jgi:hypothetical protein
MARLQALQNGGAGYDRIRSFAGNADAVGGPGQGLLGVENHGAGFNGASYDRLRSASSTVLSAALGIGSQLVSSPGEWVAVSQPAVSVVATATRAAGAAGVRHVCRSISVSLSTVVAQTPVDVVLRDGASGAGAILWVGTLSAVAGDSKTIEKHGLNIPGSAATAMTLEFQAAPVATNFERVTLTGHDVS